jgi:tRNA(Glu) U13 pseudouridine synthase TruD
MKVYKDKKVFWLRRALRVMPTDTSVRYQKEDLLIDFTLPAWSYASIIFDKLIAKLGSGAKNTAAKKWTSKRPNKRTTPPTPQPRTKKKHRKGSKPTQTQTK